MSDVTLSTADFAFVRESNKIEGITRPPTKSELDAHAVFMGLEGLTIAEVEAFVAAVADAKLRERYGMDVRVGNHVPVRGAPDMRDRLQALLDDINAGSISAYEGHINYETLHPFMDGNGRSGRVIWLWQMMRQGSASGALQLGFLHSFYYQTLDATRRVFR